MAPNVVVECLGGGLGNLLFQYFAGWAAALDLAEHPDALVFLTTDYVDGNGRTHVTDYADLLPGAVFVNAEERPLIVTPPIFRHEERGHAYHPVPLSARSYATVSMRGYFQCHAYLTKHAARFRASLESVRPEAWVRARAHVPTGDKIAVCVHLRRTDYLKLADYHTVLSPAYYERAFEALGIAADTHQIYVFSDDLVSVQGWPLWEGRGAIFVNEPDAVTTLFAMMQCRAFVLANSSLSLLAFLLTTVQGDAADANVQVPATAPLEWFGPKGPPFRMDDIVPGGVMKLSGL